MVQAAPHSVPTNEGGQAHVDPLQWPPFIHKHAMSKKRYMCCMRRVQNTVGPCQEGEKKKTPKCDTYLCSLPLRTHYCSCSYRRRCHFAVHHRSDSSESIILQNTMMYMYALYTLRGTMPALHVCIAAERIMAVLFSLLCLFI